MKEKLGPALEAAKYRGGGYTRIEPSGILFIRSICKLTHVGRKQYAKGRPSLKSYPLLHALTLIVTVTLPHSWHATGDGQAFRDFVEAKFPQLAGGMLVVQR
jgi:hypothetical protein